MGRIFQEQQLRSTPVGHSLAPFVQFDILFPAAVLEISGPREESKKFVHAPALIDVFVPSLIIMRQHHETDTRENPPPDPSAMICCGPLFAKDFFVSPSGSDASGDGTIGKPWRTIAFALESVYPGDVLFLRAGEYREQMISVRSGTPPHPSPSPPGTTRRHSSMEPASPAAQRLPALPFHMKFKGFTVRNWLHDGMSFSNCSFIELKKIRVTPSRDASA